jgi:hypothetical protein
MTKLQRGRCPAANPSPARSRYLLLAAQAILLAVTPLRERTCFQFSCHDGGSGERDRKHDLQYDQMAIDKAKQAAYSRSKRSHNITATSGGACSEHCPW